MLKTKLVKVTSLGVCMSMLMAMPAFAGTSQGNQSSQSLMQFLQNGLMMQNGQTQSNQMQNGQMMQNSQAQSNQMQSGRLQNNQMQQSQEQEQLSSAAQYMIKRGIIKGNSTGSYSMDDTVKRCDMSLMLMRAFNFDTSSSTEDTSFSDVSQGSYYYQAVSAMQQMGIAQGDGQSFRPGSTMTLEEAILFVERALDAAEIEYDEDDITALFDGRDLSDSATREDVAAILYAVLGDDAAALLTGEATTLSVVTYTTDEDTAIAFDEDDFNDVCNDATDGTLDYIVFSNPSTSLGKLYYGYTSASDYDGKVSTSDKIYLSADTNDDEIDLSDLSFVPNEDLHGTVIINYTGYDTDGNSYRGSVKITVNADEDAVADTITYTTDEDTDITFDEDDFNDACNDATDADLSYIKFALPSASYGKLYYSYGEEDQAKVSSSYKYYYGSDGEDENALSAVTFVPADDYTGTVKILYTGVNENGDTFTGTIKVTVE